MTKQETNGGVGLLELLAILFIGLKLTHHINWSWWWILCPVWGVFAIVLIVLIYQFILILIDDKGRKKRRNGF